MKCPEECPYIVPNGAFSCLFQCKKKEECSYFNPDRAFPDSLSKICMPCRVAGCRVCSGTDMCEECHEDFTASGDGTACELLLDHTGVVQKMVKGVGIALVGLVLLALVWHAVNGPNEHWEANLFAIMRARRHRRLVKVLRWDMKNKLQAASRYDLATHMASQNVLGLGLALFYNSMGFTIWVSLLFFISTYVSYKMSGVSAALSRFEFGKGGLIDNAVRVEEGAPAMVISRLMVCSDGQQASIHEDIDGFAFTNFVAMGILYVAFFVSLFLYTRYQKRETRGFMRAHAVMADYCLRVSGLPAGETDEADLRKWLEDEFRNVLPDQFPRPSQVIDGGSYLEDAVSEVEPSQIEVKGVSLCYDYSQRWGEVEDKIQGLQMRIELQAATKARVAGYGGYRGLRKMTEDDLGGKEELERSKREHRKSVTAWFEGDEKQRLKSIGEAFVVFKYSEDKRKVLREYTTGGKRLTHPKTKEALELSMVQTEPPCINWWHMGISPAERDRNVVLGLAKILAMIAAVQGLVVYPFVKYFLWPYSSVGSHASGMSMSILGIVIGNLNMVIGIQLWMTSFGMGFRRKESMDTLVLFGNTFLNIINNMLNILVTVFTVFSATHNKKGFEMLVSPTTMYSAGTETLIAKDIYGMLMPGFFFVGFLMTIVMAGVWPFLFNTFLMKLIYTWAALPKPLLKVIRVFLPWAPDDVDKYPYWRAEKGLEPMEIQIGDYSNLILVTFVCSLALFTMSPYTHKLFFAQLCWSVFYYCFLQYMHLRFCKAAFYTTDRIDIHVNVLWGLPLSVVGAAWCQWAIRSQLFASTWAAPYRYMLLLLAFLLSFALWNLVYWKVVRPEEKEDLKEDEQFTEHEVKERTFYSWFNCNPVFVLKCAYYFQNEDETPVPERLKDHPIACGEDEKKVRFYAIGKEYLFLKPERQALAFKVVEGHGHLLEIETYCEVLLDFCGRVAGVFGRGRRKVQPTPRAGAAGDDPEQAKGLLESPCSSST